MKLSNLNWDSWTKTKDIIKDYYVKFDVQSIANYSRLNSKADYNEIIENANRLKHYIFTFRKPLDMEPCHIPYYFKNFGWMKSPNGDIEWLFMLHRQEYLIDLVIAYFETGDIVYLEKWKEFVLQWIHDNPLNKDTKPVAWRTIDTGIRCFHWCQSLLLVLPQQFLTEEEEKTIMMSMKEQLIYIRDAYIDKHDLSNWGVLQLAGMFICESWFGEVLLLDTKEWAKEKLKVQLFLQINENGVHWEQSPLYQYETLYYFVSVIHHAQEMNNLLDEGFINRTKELVRHSVHLRQPDGTLIPQSDTDQIDLSYLLNFSEIIFKEKFIPFQKQEGRYASVAWLVGWHKFESYLKDAYSNETFDTTAIDPKTGNSWVRTGWDEKATLLTAHNGPVGSGHGHLDLGHFNFTYQGIPVFVDGGRFTYEESPIRTHLKSSKAHNTLIVDNQNLSEERGSWKYGRTAVPHTFNFIEKDDVSVTESIYTSRLQDNSLYTVRRRYIFVKELSSVLILDFVMADGEHRVNRLFHTSPQVTINKISTSKLELQTKDGSLYQHFLYDTKIKINDNFMSPIYNSLANTKKIDAHSKFKDYGTFLTVLAPENISVYTDKVKQSGTDKNVNPIFMEAVVLEGDKKFTILNGQLDTVHGDKIYKYNDLSFYGRLNIVNDRGELTRYL